MKVLIMINLFLLSTFLTSCTTNPVNKDNIRNKQDTTNYYLKKEYAKSTNIQGFSKPSPYLLPKKIREKQPYILIQENNKQPDPPSTF